MTMTKAVRDAIDESQRTDSIVRISKPTLADVAALERHAYGSATADPRAEREYWGSDWRIHIPPAVRHAEEV